MRIVSLLPSATEIVASLGLDDQLVGVTHECDWPKSAARLPKVTKTLIPTDASSAEIDALVRDKLGAQSALYTLDMDVLERLEPDLIVTQALCDVCAVAEEEVKNAACSLPGNPRVVNLEPERLGEVLDCIRTVARATGNERRADVVVAELQARVNHVVERAQSMTRRPRVALLEWLDPPFSTGHWNPELVRLAGGVDLLGQEGKKSVTIRWEQIVAYQPEIVLISCCGFTIERTMQEVGVLRDVDGWDDIPAVRDGRVWVTDGSSYFSRPGPRLVDSLELLAHVIHPETFDLPAWVTPPVRLKGVGSSLSGGEVKIRQYQAADRRAYQTLREKLWPGCSDSDNDTWFARNDATSFLAFRDDGSMCGFVEVGSRPYAEDCDSSPVGYIEGWWVDDDMRRHGVGRALIEAAEHWARGKGYTEMASDALLDNLVSHAAHHACGYEEVERLVCFRRTL